ncbi:MAG: queuosine precursor transporter [Spirochaetaceae bacterium]|nr:queuosine precursor transporter [Spirochaetaceae bacterium]
MNELLWLAMLLVNFGAILFSYRLWGKAGLYLWIPIAVIVANIQVTKTIELFGLTATLGNIVYATSFLVTDILSENYGKKDAARAVGMGFFSLIIMTVLMNLALYFIPDSSDFAQGSLSSIFSLMPRIALGSLAAYGFSQLHDIWAYDLWRRRFPSKKFIWLRNNFSTMVSQLLDTLIFTLIAFWGVFETSVLIDIMLSTYVLKWVVALLDTPFLYVARNWHDKRVVDRD